MHVSPAAKKVCCAIGMIFSALSMTPPKDPPNKLILSNPSWSITSPAHLP